MAALALHFLLAANTALHPALPVPTLQQRTHWHDILGSHCPKFGVKRLVAVPLPQPVGYKVADEYKVQVRNELVLCTARL